MVMSVDGSAVVGQIKTVSNTPLVFGVNDAERMRITSGGNVGIGTTSPSSLLHINGSGYFPSKLITLSGAEPTRYSANIGTLIVDGSKIGLALGTRSDNVNYDNSLVVVNGNVGIGTTSPTQRLDVVGNGVFSGSVTATAFFASSDIRLKDIISHDGDMITYKWKDGRDNKIHYGYSAQNLQSINPNLVNKNDDGFLSVNYTETLVLKVRELEKEVQLLKAQIN
jgi:hypothetical protein